MQAAALLVLLVASPALASDTLGPAKDSYGFDVWPGKGAVLRQGVALGDVDMDGYVVHSHRNRLSTSGEMILRYAAPNATKPDFEVGVRVFDSVAAAQHHLLVFLDGSTMFWPRGDTLGLDTGDVSFTSGTAGALDTIVFTRANVYVRVAMLASASSTPDIAAIAGRIDARILGEKKAKSAKHLKKPKIVACSPASAVTQPNAPVRIDLEVTDPRGEDVQIHFDEAGAVVWEQEGTWWFQAEKPLDYTVTLFAVNEHYLMSTRSFTIRVEK